MGQYGDNEVFIAMERREEAEFIQRRDEEIAMTIDKRIQSIGGPDSNPDSNVLPEKRQAEGERRGKFSAHAMTIREVFAAAALHAILGREQMLWNAHNRTEGFAHDAVTIADALLRELNPEGK